MAEHCLQCIGATTIDEYRKHIEKDAALERRFQPVKVPEPSVDETIQILRGLCDGYEIHHNVHYTDEAMVAAARLSGARVLLSHGSVFCKLVSFVSTNFMLYIVTVFCPIKPLTSLMKLVLESSCAMLRYKCHFLKLNHVFDI